MKNLLEPFNLEDFLKVSAAAGSWRKGADIWNGACAPGLYRVQSGMVRRFRWDGEIQQFLGFHCKGDYFGESFLTGSPESAIAVHPCELIHWPASTLVPATVELLACLSPLFASRAAEAERRLSWIRVGGFVRERVTETLLDLANRVGEEAEDGTRRLPALTHDLLAHVAGTSREIVTCQMNLLRRQKLIRYSRKAIIILPEMGPQKAVGAVA